MAKANNITHEVATGFGWRWTDAGPVITVTSGNQRVEVLVPLENVWVTFGQEMAAVGCPLPASVGDYSVGGLFSGIKRAARKAKRTVRRGTRSVNRAARGIRKARRRIERTAKRYGRKATSLARRGAKAYLATNPVLKESLKLQRRFGRNPLVQSALSLYPPAAAANQALTMSNQFLRGERVNPLNVANLAASYIPGGGAAAQGLDYAARAQQLYSQGQHAAQQFRQGGRPNVPAMSRAAYLQEAVRNQLAQRY